ncbi:hypothetical protein FRC08_015219 [Ceratobasidium sp. 394]|nr:hypothetical protein FRC08_015219 [Ceratobasidium sp. 394]
MPAADPADQRAARDFEQSLRYDVLSGRAPQAKLDWFSALPKRVRRSRQLIDEALGPFQAARERAKEELVQQRTEGFLRDLRLAALRQQPRDLSCLRGDGTPWAGIGRRKKRCRAFRATGQAYVLHKTLAMPSATPIFTLDRAPDIPTRPPTPPELRDTVWNLPGLYTIAQGPATYGLNSPETRPTPEPHHVPAHLPPPAYPASIDPEILSFCGHTVNRDLAYIVARGRHAVSPWQRYSVRDAVVDIVGAEYIVPDMLGRLARLFCPEGVDQYDDMVYPSALLVDFCRGWFEVGT